jgi:eukaryotic-like serine/threonine-protein kinase
MPDQPDDRVRFGVFEADLRGVELRKQGRPVKIQSQPFQILSILLENPGELVSREDLRQRLWPADTFVDFDRSLNKAMNKLRTALGDSADNPRFIETVPRHGYRFIAPVSVDGNASRDLQTFQTTPSPGAARHPLPQGGEGKFPFGLSAALPRGAAGFSFRPRLWRTTALILAGAFAVSVAALVRMRVALHGSLESIASRRSVAVLGFRNLSGRRDEEWLATALPDWLTTELAAGDQLRAVPQQSVERTMSELALPEGVGLAKDSLARIRKNLGADEAIAGSYAILGKEPNGEIRLDLDLQNTATGEILSTVTETGTEADLFDLVSRAGAQLRASLGARAVTAEEAAQVRATLPSNQDAVRFYSEGLAKLRVFDALGARDTLREAVEADPDNALAHSALAAAWAALGYDRKAEEEAGNAVRLSSGLARDQRLLIEARYCEVSAQWRKAATVYRTLYSFSPDNLDYGLALAADQTREGNGRAAMATIQLLRRLPLASRNDPRIDLCEGNAAESLGDFKHVAVAAAAAAAKAQAAGASLLLARALNIWAWAYMNQGDLAAASQRSTRAEKLFVTAGDLAGAANSATLGAIAAQQHGDLQGARRMFAQGLALYERIGDWDGVATEHNNLGVVLDGAADLPLARKEFEQSLATYRELGHRDGVALTESNLAGISLELGDPLQAEKEYRQSLRICRELGNRSKAAGDLAGLGRALRAEGKLKDASSYLTQAIEIYNAIGDRESASSTRVDMANLLLEQRQAARAGSLARSAAEEFRRENVPGNESLACAVLARAFLEQGRISEARSVMERAQALPEASRNPSVALYLALTAARIDSASGDSVDTANAITSLRGVVSEAAKSGFVISDLEARLALSRIEISSGDAASARAGLEALQRDAADRGLGLIARKAAAMLISNPGSSSSPPSQLLRKPAGSSSI